MFPLPRRFRGGKFLKMEIKPRQMSFQRRLESSIFNGFMDSRFHGNDSLLKLSALKPLKGED
jgi:hypothetical protein